MSSSEVQIATYDLSQGMARALSGQFLGGPDHAIDIIPHTGIIVFGREYYFGSGIQNADPMEFRQSMGLYPINVQSIGYTNVTKTQFERWCYEQSLSRYSVTSYDLLHRNCNNFSHDAAVEGLQLNRGVPQWILDVPNKFLSSPMGQMIRPMLENMQLSAPGRNTSSSSMGMGGMMGGAAPQPTFANIPPPTTTTSSTASAASNSQSNPWAKIPPKTTNSSSSTTTNTKSSSLPTAATAITTPLLDSFNKPFVSNDVKTVPICVNKITAKLEKEEEKATITEIGQVLTGSNKPQPALIEQASQVIFDLLQNGGSTAFALMLFRVIVIHYDFSPSSTSAVKLCLDKLITELTTTTSSSMLLKSTAARSMAWVCLSNALAATTTKTMFSQQIKETLIDAAVTEISTQDDDGKLRPKEIRQAAAAFLYNIVLLQQQHSSDDNNSSSNGNEELSDTTVSMLCGTLENIGEREGGGDQPNDDPTTRLRCIMVTARIMKPIISSSSSNNSIHINKAAKNLINDLGFTDALREGINKNDSSKNSDDDKAKCQILIKELVQLLE